MIPLAVFIPLILGTVSYALFTYKRYKKFVLRHLFSVLVFSLAWFPVALLHFWNYKDFSNPPKLLKDVTATQLAAIAGALSGFLTIAAMIALPKLVLWLQKRKHGHRLGWNEMKESAVDTLQMDSH